MWKLHWEITTYQLQYLLSDVKRRNEPIPAALDKSNELLSAAELSASIPHEQLVFKNVAELQDLNTKLTLSNQTIGKVIYKPLPTKHLPVISQERMIFSSTRLLSVKPSKQ